MQIVALKLIRCLHKLKHAHDNNNKKKISKEFSTYAPSHEIAF